MALEPHVREALAAASLFHALLERVELALRVLLDRLWGAEHVAQVEEVLLVGSPLRQRGVGPTFYERLRCEGCHTGMLPTAAFPGHRV